MGLSLAITAIGGMVIYWLNWELNTNSWTILLGSVTVLAGVVAIMRYQNLAKPNPIHSRVNFSLSMNDLLLFVLAGVGIVISFALAYQGEIFQNNSDFTQLWMLPDEVSETNLLVGINNHADAGTQYRLEIEVDGKIISEIQMIELQSEETWQYEFSLPEDANTVTAHLYRWYASADDCSVESPPEICSQNEEVYREVVYQNWLRK